MFSREKPPNKTYRNILIGFVVLNVCCLGVFVMKKGSLQRYKLSFELPSQSVCVYHAECPRIGEYCYAERANDSLSSGQKQRGILFCDIAEPEGGLHYETACELGYYCELNAAFPTCIDPKGKELSCSSDNYLVLKSPLSLSKEDL